MAIASAILEDTESIALSAATAQERGDAVKVVADLAVRGDPGERVLAIRALGALRRRECTPVLAEALAEENDEAIATEAARALVRSGGPAAVDALRGAAQRGGYKRRAAVADALGVFGDERALGELAELSDHESAEVRHSAVRAIGRLGDRRGVAALGPRLTDDYPSVRSQARDALVVLGGPEAVAALRHNPRRLSPLRRHDLFRARASMRHGAATARRKGGREGDFVTAKLVALAAKMAALASAIVAADLVVLGASPVALGLAALVGAAVVGLRRKRRDNTIDDPLDVALARLSDCPTGFIVRPPVRTVVADLVARPVLTAAWLLVPLALDVAMTAIGIVPGVGAGILVASGLTRVFDARRVRRFERVRGMRLATWTAPTRRYYCNTTGVLPGGMAHQSPCSGS